MRQSRCISCSLKQLLDKLAFAIYYHNTNGITPLFTDFGEKGVTHNDPYGHLSCTSQNG